MTTEIADLDWVPAACTLPTPEQPLRVAEFDALFAASSRRVERLTPTHLRLTLTPADDIEVPMAQVAVLDALAARAEAVAP